LVLASDEDGGTLEALKFSLASDIVELVVLTTDELFLQTLRDAAGSSRRLWHVLSPDKVSDLLVAGEVGIVVLDAQALHEASRVFVEQIKRQFPDLVIVAAGLRGDEISLAGLISAGLVYRFIHKPMSPARAKLFADAAIKKYEDQRRRAADTPRHNRASPPNAVWLIGGAIAALALIAVIAFVVHRSGSDEETALAPAGATKTATAESALLTRAGAALAANKLTEPAGENALELYSRLQARNPADPNARAGLLEVHERLLARAENALLEERLDEAAEAIETARKSGVESGRIAFLTAQLAKSREQIKTAQAQVQAQAQPPPRPRAEPKVEEAHVTPPPNPAAQRPADARLPEPERDSASGAAAQASTDTAQAVPAGARKQAEADTWGQLLKNANDRLLQDRLIEPSNDSAKYFYLALKQLEPANPALNSVLQDLGTRLAAKARRALILGQNEAAKSWLDEAGSVGFASAEISSAQRDLAAAFAKQNFMTNLVPAGQLTVLKSVQPVYPSKAEGKKLEGWVDMEFTVSEAGKVKDVAVRAASPAGIFEDAAVKAVSQWRYQPVLRDAKPVPVRTQLRIRFTFS
jgi:TonB family protein